MQCKVCDGKSRHFAHAQILGKYLIEYFRCPNCEFIQTESPYWINEAYASPIAAGDLGSVNRAVQNSIRTKKLILHFLTAHAKFVDYGAGYGIFVRMMRDIGFNFHYHDRYCENIFATDHEAHSGTSYELLTAFEVFEHFENPVDSLSELTQWSENIFFSTELVPDHCPKPEEWWYYALDYGQHISFFTKKSLRVLADRFDCTLYSSGNYHFISKRLKIPGVAFNTVLDSRYPGFLTGLLEKYRRISCLLNKDASAYWLAISREKSTNNRAWWSGWGVSSKPASGKRLSGPGDNEGCSTCVFR